MTEKKFCRLCISLCCDYKEMYDEDGQGNSVYEITFKYFDPMLLSADHEQDSKVVCLECWNSISSFHDFQKNVLQAHEDLEKSMQEIANQAMWEEEIKLELLSPTSRKGVSKSDELKNEVTFNTEDEDDDLPLSLRLEKVKRSKHISKNNIKSTNEENDKKTKIQGKSKPQSSTTKDDKSNREEEQSQEADDTYTNDNDDDTCSNNDKDAIIAKWKPELECNLCSATAVTFNLLRSHFRDEHPDEKCYVMCCERRFSKRCDIYEHIQFHIDPDVFKCKICGKCSTNSRNLAKHIRDLHTEEGKERPFECGVCQKRFQNKTKLRTHMEVHDSGRDHICSECGKGFSTEQRRKIHERMVHNVDRVCDQCGKTIHGIYALKQHMLQEHEGVKKPKWPCDQCDDQLHSHSSLKRHKQLRHHDGTTAYICSDCGKMFQSQSALHSHKRLVHIMQRKYKCEICEKAFKFPKNLREHMASHTGIDLYQCSNCPKTFKNSANLHHHRKKEHLKEWSEGRIKKNTSKSLNISLVKNEIVI